MARKGMGLKPDQNEVSEAQEGNSHRLLYVAQCSTQMLYAVPATILSPIAPHVDTGGRYFFSRKKKSMPRQGRSLPRATDRQGTSGRTDDEHNGGNAMNRDVNPRRDPQQLRSLGRGSDGTGAFWGDACHVGDDQSGR